MRGRAGGSHLQEACRVDVEREEEAARLRCRETGADYQLVSHAALPKQRDRLRWSARARHTHTTHTP
eukprot:3353684-Prymnesium_polylepis.1